MAINRTHARYTPRSYSKQRNMTTNIKLLIMTRILAAVIKMALIYYHESWPINMYPLP